MAAVITRLAAQVRPDLVERRPTGNIDGLAFDAVVARGPLHSLTVAHWADISPAQADKALDRLSARGIIQRAGFVTVKGHRRQTYRAPD